MRAFKDLAEGRKRTIELCSNHSVSSEEQWQRKDRLAQGLRETIEIFTKIVDTDVLILELALRPGAKQHTRRLSKVRDLGRELTVPALVQTLFKTAECYGIKERSGMIKKPKKRDNG